MWYGAAVAKGPIYRVTFLYRGQVYEIYARGVSHGALLGFVEVEELLLPDPSKLVVDSSEERLRSEFDGVRRTYIPVHSVLRIDEVEKAGPGRITARSDGEGKVTPFPVPVFTPRPGGGGRE